MDICFAPNNVMQLDNVAGRQIIFKNFGGLATQYNREGERKFSLRILDTNTADDMIERGWNVKARDNNPDEDPFMHLPVKVKFNGHGPNVYLWAGKNRITLDEESIKCLDEIEIEYVNLDIRPYDWNVNGRTGRTAYLQSMEVFQRIDRFAARYATEDKGETLPF